MHRAISSPSLQTMQPTVIRPLTLEQPLCPGLPAHVAAASGVAVAGSWLHVIPDDAQALASFAFKTHPHYHSNPVQSKVGTPQTEHLAANARPGYFHSSSPGRLHLLFEEAPLPPDEHERKRLKPDLESLALVPFKDYGALLALGSGSSELRQRGIIQPLSSLGEPQGKPTIFDLSPLYRALPYRSLNIEGVACTNNQLWLAQRGNSAEGYNAIIALNLEGCLRAALEQLPWSERLICDIIPVDLGLLKGVPLTLTDLSAYGKNRLLFSAAAEDTDDPYHDGAVVGSLLGSFNIETQELKLLAIDSPWKIEGIEAIGQGEVLMVTDGDDPLKPALLLKAEIDES